MTKDEKSSAIRRLLEYEVSEEYILSLGPITEKDILIAKRPEIECSGCGEIIDECTERMVHREEHFHIGCEICLLKRIVDITNFVSI